MDAFSFNLLPCPHATRAQKSFLLLRVSLLSPATSVLCSVLGKHSLPTMPASTPSASASTKKTTNWGQSPIGSFSPSPINRYRIAAIVRHMCEIGLYDMQKCKSAKTTEQGQSPIGSFRLLCQMLFPDVDAAQADLYRRGCTNYACYEDECLIRNFMMEGCRYE